MSPKPVTQTNPQSLAQAVGKISQAMHELRSSGLNEHAIIVLMADSTKLSKRTITKVLTGLNDLGKFYLEKNL
jgi:hypothetical protein